MHSLAPSPSFRLLAAGVLALGIAPLAGSGVLAQETSQSKTEAPIDLSALAAGPGLKGTMHGAVPGLGTYVFTWWHPKGFFRNENLSLVPNTPEVGKQLADLERHQAAKVWGKLVRVTAGQTHVQVERIEPGEKWSPGVDAVPNQRVKPEELARDLAGKQQIKALVHAIAEDGSALAVEYRDEVIPVQVPPNAALRKAVAGLYRGDRIQMRYRVAEHPKRPIHLVLHSAPGSERAMLEVTDSIHALHEQERTVVGNLVLFPKSPVLQRTIWGVEERGPNGLHRYFTIFNFEDKEDQAKIESALQAAWKANPRGVKDARNKYVHTGVRVRVTGEVNNPAHNQANPTLVTRAERVQVIKGAE